MCAGQEHQRKKKKKKELRFHCNFSLSLSPSAETWFSILFTVMVEIVPPSVRAVVVGIFLFGMNNIGGNLPIVVDPVSEKYDYRTALLIFFPGFVGASQ